MIPRPKFRISHTWIISAVVAAVSGILAVAAMYLFPIRKLVADTPTPQTPFLSLQKPSDYADALREQSLLMDQAPLFLPTTWNTSRAGYVISGRLGKTELSEPFKVEIEIESGMIASQDPPDFPAVTAYSSEYNDASALMKIGRNNSVKDKIVLRPRGACYVVMDDKSGKKVLVGAIEQPIAEAGDLLWQPAEFWVRVVQEGVSGDPLLAMSTGSDTLDLALRKILDGLNDIASLPLGYYKVVVGP